MSDLVRLFLIFVVIVNPAGYALLAVDLSANPDDRRPSAHIFAALLSLALVAGSVLLGERLLEALDVSLPSFQVATGVLLVLSALTIFLGGGRSSDAPAESQGWIVARLVLWLASPATLAAGIAYGLDRGLGPVLVAVGAALVATATLAIVTQNRLGGGSWRAVAAWASRGLTAILVVVAVDLIRQGVESV